MKATELIGQAHRLARATQRRPRQVDLKRAVSAAYYARFHALARLCADTITGVAPTRSTKAWQQTYRAPAHGFAKNACAQAHNKGFPPTIVRFAQLFVLMQQQRHAADYDPFSGFRRADVVTMVESVERAIVDFKMALRSDLRAFVALVLLDTRPR